MEKKEARNLQGWGRIRRQEKEKLKKKSERVQWPWL